MNVAMATSAAAPGRPNEDFVGTVPGAVVLLDGAGMTGIESICGHGVAWYTHRLGGALLGLLSRDDGQDLVTILGSAIEQIAAVHRDTCDITNPSSPQATAAIFRVAGDRAEYLVLADTFLVLGRAAAADPQVVTDEREVMVRELCGAVLDGVLAGTPEYDLAVKAYIERLRARRNRPGGYWIAKDDPSAAAESITGSCAAQDLDSVALLTNGAARIVSPYGLADWPGVLSLLDTLGPPEIIRRIRDREASVSSVQPADAKPADDATVAHCTGFRAPHRV